MPKRIPHHSVVVHRDGKNIRPPLGQPFEFTQEEVDQIHGFNPAALRRPIIERITPEVTSEDNDDMGDIGDAPAARAASRKSGRKAAAAQVEDDEL